MIRSRSARVGSLVALALVGLTTSPAAADEGTARRLFARGQRAFDAGRYEQALESLTAAYEAAPLPGFLYNIGLCHRRLEHWAEARDHFERYLAAVPEAPNRADVEQLLAEVAEHLPPPEPPPAPEPEPEPELEPVVTREPAPAPTPSAPPPPRGGGVSALTWTAIAAGVVFAGGAAFFSLRLSAAQDEYDGLDCARDGDRCRALRDDGETAALYQNVLGVTSGLVLVASIVMLAVDLTSEPDSEGARVSMVPGGRYSAVRMSW